MNADKPSLACGRNQTVFDHESRQSHEFDPLSFLFHSGDSCPPWFLPSYLVRTCIEPPQLSGNASQLLRVSNADQGEVIGTRLRCMGVFLSVTSLSRW